MSNEKMLMAIGETLKSHIQRILARETSGTGQLANSLKISIDPMEGSVTVGSDSAVALFTEYGTGIRGSEGFQKYFDETKPEFTIPIKPKNKKALRWMQGGNTVFAKSTKGMKPIAAFRRGLFNSKPDVIKAIQENLSEA